MAWGIFKVFKFVFGLLVPRPPSQPAAAIPQAATESKVPRAEVGVVIPVLFGTVIISNPNVIGKGEFGIEPIKG